MRTSFHHQPEAQHPKFSAIHKCAGRLPHLWVISRHRVTSTSCPLCCAARKRGGDLAILLILSRRRTATKVSTLKGTF